MHLLFDLDKITPQQLEESEQRFFKETSSSSEKTILVVDSDAGIIRNQHKNLPIIAWQHEYNRQESLMGTAWLILSLDVLTPDYLEEVYARYYKKPLEITRTRRCIIRELTLEDLPYLMALQSKEAGDGCFFPTHFTEGTSKEEYYDFLKSYIDTQYPFFGFGIYAILKKEDDSFLGIAGFSDTEVAHIANISYSILPNAQRQGYATEAVEALLPLAVSSFGFTDVIAIIHKENTASLRLAKKCGIRITH